MKPISTQISPSILSADFGCLNKEIAAVEKYSERLHIDVMDGQFVPNLTFGAPVVRKIKSNLPLDCHLMVEHPEKYLDDFKKAGATTIIIHTESKGNCLKTLKKIKKMGVKAGICLKPKTKINVLTKNLMKYVDHLLIMSVEPGFGGQKFMPNALPKIKKARKLYPDLEIAVDGGINDKTAKQCIQAGANILIAGSFIFGSSNYKKAIQKLRS